MAESPLSRFPTTSLSLLGLENSDLYHRRMTKSREAGLDVQVDYEELLDWQRPPELPERNPIVVMNVYDQDNPRSQPRKSGYFLFVPPLNLY